MDKRIRADKPNLDNLKAETSRFIRELEDADVAVERNPFVPLLLNAETSPVEARKAFRTLKRWKRSVKSSREEYSADGRHAADGLLDADPFLEAAIIFEFVCHNSSDLRQTLFLLPENGKAPLNPRKIRDRCGRLRRTIAACEKVLSGYEALIKLNFCPGPGGLIVGDSNLIEDVYDIAEESKEELRILENPSVIRRVNGEAQIYRPKGKARFQDDGRYLLLHLRELLCACLGSTQSSVLPLLIPVGTWFGAIKAETKEPEHLQRKLIKCDSKRVRSNFMATYGQFLTKLPSNLSNHESIEKLKSYLDELAEKSRRVTRIAA